MEPRTSAIVPNRPARAVPGPSIGQYRQGHLEDRRSRRRRARWRGPGRRGHRRERRCPASVQSPAQRSPELLTTVQTELGGVLTIGYSPAGRFSTDPSHPECGLPLGAVRPAVTTISASDGRQARPSVTTYGVRLPTVGQANATASSDSKTSHLLDAAAVNRPASQQLDRYQLDDECGSRNTSSGHLDTAGVYEGHDPSPRSPRLASSHRTTARPKTSTPSPTVWRGHPQPLPVLRLRRFREPETGA